MKPLLLSLALTCLASSCALANSLVIKAKHMVDVENGKLIENPIVVIEGNLFKQIGQQGQIKIPEDAQVIDLPEHTLLPGFMDMHVHLTSSARHHGYKRLAISLPRSALYGVVSAEKTLMSGFTTVRNVGAPDTQMSLCVTP